MVVSRLTDQCPAAFGPNATCDSSPGAATIEDVGFVSHRDLETGNLEFTINNSNYSTTAERDSMIALVASSMESSSPRSNCTEEGYEEGCSLKSGIIDTAPEKCKKGTVTVCTATDGVNVEITEGDDGVVAFMVRTTLPISPRRAISCTAKHNNGRMSPSSLMYQPRITFVTTSLSSYSQLSTLYRSCGCTRKNWDPLLLLAKS